MGAKSQEATRRPPNQTGAIGCANTLLIGLQCANSDSSQRSLGRLSFLPWPLLRSSGWLPPRCYRRTSPPSHIQRLRSSIDERTLFQRRELASSWNFNLFRSHHPISAESNFPISAVQFAARQGPRRSAIPARKSTPESSGEDRHPRRRAGGHDRRRSIRSRQKYEKHLFDRSTTDE